MTDTFSSEDRTQIMRRIRSKNTAPEMKARSFLHRHGLRFRIHSKKLPGKPDIVLKKYKTVIFVHGCFWHQHQDPKCKRASVPKSRPDYWLPKLKKTVTRDKEHLKLLHKLGWTVHVIWECQINEERLKKLLHLIKGL